MNGEKSLCITEYFGASNQGVKRAIGPALKMVEAGETNEIGQFVVSCERCGADFSLSAEVGSPTEMQLLNPTETPDEACVEVRGKQKDEWAMNLSKNWFPVEVLTRNLDKEKSEEQYFSPANLLEEFEAIGKKVEDRYATEKGTTEYKHWQLPKSGIEGIFKLGKDTRAKFTWFTRPEFLSSRE